MRRSAAEANMAEKTTKAARTASAGRSKEPQVLRAYHCTRLLPHEVSMIREQGLRPLTEALVTDRIRQAHKYHAITRAQRDELLRGGHVFCDSERWRRKGRENQVCFISSRRLFEQAPGACIRFLSMWGGEGIYMSNGGGALRPLLRTLGRPAIVVVDLDPKVQCRTDGGLDVFYPAPVPPERIVDLWQPGHQEYDVHSELPSE
jgi:hypothetical protein